MKKKTNKKTVTKDATGISIPTTLSDYNTPTPSVNVVQTPPSSGQSFMPVTSWPLPSMWYQQGKEAAKKVYIEYLNAMNQFLNTPQDQGDRILEYAGRMNSVVISMIQGIALATEALEEVNRRVRTADQSAVIESEAIKDSLSRLLKTVWVHNTAAYSGKNPGLEVKVIEGQLVGRINRASQLGANDIGTPISSPEEANQIWLDQPIQNPPDAALQQMADVVPQEEEPQEEVLDTGGTLPEEEVVEEEEVPVEEEIPIEEEEVPVEEEIPIEEETGEEEIPIEEEVPVEEEIPIEEEIGEEEAPVEEEVSEEEIPEEEVSEEEIPIEEEIGEEEIPEEEDQAIEETEEEAPAEETETIYCIVCDKDVTLEDIEACQNPKCPFATEEIGSPELSDSEEMGEEEEEEEIPEKTKKHFVMVDHDDHSKCNTYNFKVKEFSGVEGEYCLSCQKALSYSFDAQGWDTDSVKHWVQKQFKIQKKKNQSAEEIVKETVDRIPPTVLKEWLEEEKRDRTGEKLEINSDEMRNVLRDVLDEAFSPLSRRLANLES